MIDKTKGKNNSGENNNKREGFHEKLPPIHPGEILREELLIPHDISPQQLAEALKVPKEQIKWLCEERADITPELAARLAIYFNSTVEFWLNLQRSYEDEIAEERINFLKKEKEVIPYERKQVNGRRLWAK